MSQSARIRYIAQSPRIMALANSPEPINYGGYDYNFVNMVQDRLYCSTVCTKVLRDPHLTKCCGQHFCESCLNYWFEKHHGQSCPHCRAEGNEFQHFLNKSLKREISELKVWCSNKHKGCEWSGEVDGLEKHINSEDGCRYVEIECPNNNNQILTIFERDLPMCPKILRKDLDQHTQKTCVRRLVACKFCTENGTHYRIEGRHSDVCKKYPLACPNKCGVPSIPREDMPAHREECPLEPLTCPFAEAGCGVKLVRQQFDKHLADNQQVHLLQLMGDYKKMKEQLNKMTKAFTVETGRLKSLQESISRDVVQLQGVQEISGMDSILNSVQTKLGTGKNKIDIEGIDNGLTFTVPSEKYFEHNKDWYSPDLYIKHFKTCLLAQLVPPGYLKWSFVVLEQKRELCGNMLIGRAPIWNDIMFELPCPFETGMNQTHATIPAKQLEKAKPTTRPLPLTVFIKRDMLCLLHCAHCSCLTF